VKNIKTNTQLQKLKPIIVKILKKKGIRKAGIFGSFARGEQNKKSDIDILIDPPKGMGLEYVSLGLELKEKLGRRVDLLTYNSIHPYLKERILSEEVRIL
jgi:predicted nucleotidyltransferase